MAAGAKLTWTHAATSHHPIVAWRTAPSLAMRIVVQIGGMRTVHCVRAVFQALAGVPGVERADVSMGEARLDTTPAFDPSAIRAGLKLLGYEVGDIQETRRPLPMA